MKNLMQIFLLGLMLLFSFSCQIKTEGEDTLTERTLADIWDGLAGIVINEMESDLSSAQFSQSQISPITSKAETNVQEAGLTESNDIGQVVPSVMSGSILGVAYLSSVEDKITAMEVITGCMTKSLSGRMSNVSGAVLNSDSNQPQYNASSYTTLLNTIVQLAVQNLDDVGIDSSQINDATKRMVKAVSGNFSAAGVSEADSPAVSKSVTTTAISYLDEAGFSGSDLQGAIQSVISGMLTGIKNLGWDSTAIGSVADEITEGAVLGLVDAGISASDFEVYLEVIKTGVSFSLSEAGLSFADIIALQDEIDQAAESGRSVFTNKSFTSFQFPASSNSTLSSDTTGVIDSSNYTITMGVPLETDMSALIASFETNGQSVKIGDTVQTSGTSANDFNSSVTYTVTAQDGSTQNYTVNVSISLVQQAYIKAVNNSAGDQFGRHISLSGDTLAVGADHEGSNQTTITNGATASADNSSAESGAAYIYVREGETWSQQAYIKASNSNASDQFGYSVALYGDTLAVGARDEDSSQITITNGSSASADNSNADSGAVYIYTRSGTTWSQQAYIKAANSGAGDKFGSQICLYGDTLAVAASSEDSNQTTITNGATASGDNSRSDSGAVYIYTRSGTNWSQQAYIKTVNSDSGDLFGFILSLSDNSLAVSTFDSSNQTTITNGATASADNSANSSGAVFVYTRSGTTWSQQAFIKSANSESLDYFGHWVSISGDTLAAGAWKEDSNQTAITNGTTASSDNSSEYSGAVYIYTRDGTDWSQQAYIKAANNDASDNFGEPVVLSGDTLVVGAQYEDSNQTTITNGTTASDDNSNGDSGAVYVYKRKDAVWSQVTYLKAANNDGGDRFGHKVSLSGETLAISALHEDSNQTTITNGTTASGDNSSADSGAVYIYR